VITAEQLADAPGFPDELRNPAAAGLDAAHRAAVLERRLTHLVNARR